MKIIEQYHEVMTPIDGIAIIKHLELCGRKCYKSEDKITEESAQRMMKALIKSGHHSVIEHYSISVLFVTDRGVTHELVRHRLCAFSQESTRYCNYSKGQFGGEITFVNTVYWKTGSHEWVLWKYALDKAERVYLDLIKAGARPQEARSVLPNSLKTEIVTTANIKEWRHILALRAVGLSGAPHPQMQQLMLPLLKEFHDNIPVLFDDLYKEAFEKGLYK